MLESGCAEAEPGLVSRLLRVQGEDGAHRLLGADGHLPCVGPLTQLFQGRLHLRLRRSDAPVCRPDRQVIGEERRLDAGWETVGDVVDKSYEEERRAHSSLRRSLSDASEAAALPVVPDTGQAVVQEGSHPGGVAARDAHVD